MSAECFRRIDGMPICLRPLRQEVRGIPVTCSLFVLHHLSLKACPSLVGAWGCSMVVVGFFVFLYGLPENSVDFLEMLDAFTEFALFSHQHSVASLEFSKAQAQRFLLCSSGAWYRQLHGVAAPETL